VAPAREPEAGKRIEMRLMGETAVQFRPDGDSQTLCRPNVSPAGTPTSGTGNEARPAAWKRQSVDVDAIRALLDDVQTLDVPEARLQSVILSGMWEPNTH
jgi:hypothetical protein